jgi:hypothetical protein
MQKPKNRRAVFTRQRQPEPTEVHAEIPRGSKLEIRRLIVDEALHSTTVIAETLNNDGFPCASADRWTASLVDSALRRQDMEGLKEVMKENRGDEPSAPSPSILEIKQAMDDTVRDALKDYGGSSPSSPDVDVATLRKAVTDTVKGAFDGLREQIDDANEAANRILSSQIQTGVKDLMSDADLVAIRRVTAATGRNVGDIIKKIDDTCEGLHNEVVETLKTHSAAVMDACENMALQLSDQVDKRFDKIEASLIEKITGEIDLDEALANAVDTRLKTHLDETVNRFAIMLGNLKRDLMGGNYSHGKY